MINFNSAGIDAFVKALEVEYGMFEVHLSRTFAKWTRKVFKGLVEGSPQWSGDMTANWNYSVKLPDYSYDPVLKEELDQVFLTNVKQRGDQQAISIALSRMSAVMEPTWRDVVYFNNETPIAEDVENMTVKIRPVNLIDGRVAMVQYTLDNAGSLYQPDV